MINITDEVEAECGGLLSHDGKDLFKPFLRIMRIGKVLVLSLAIAQRGIELNRGTIEARNIAGKRCIFKMSLPLNANSVGWKENSNFENSSHPH